MTTVTGLTAARMAATEDAAIIGAHISGNNLILEREDGGTINAGDVRGPAGPVGVATGTWTPSWSTISLGSGANFLNQGSYTFVGGQNSGDSGILSLRISARFGTTSPVFPNGTNISVSTPPGFNMVPGPINETYFPYGDAVMSPAGVNANSVLGKVGRFNLQLLNLFYVDPTTQKMITPTATAPFTWNSGTGTYIDITATFRAVRT